ncbi:hypothetical protein F4678DRAFT_468025 [Xylaria arbuscula]|nr:hypothetical protein F4678DRAFT_468025 [Xylaria arbuscula]
MASRTGGRIDILVNNAGYILMSGVDAAGPTCSLRSRPTCLDKSTACAPYSLSWARPKAASSPTWAASACGTGRQARGSTARPKRSSLLAEALRGEVRAGRVIDDLAEGVNPTTEALSAYSLRQPSDSIKVAQLVVEGAHGQ